MTWGVPPLRQGDGELHGGALPGGQGEHVAHLRLLPEFPAAEGDALFLQGKPPVAAGSVQAHEEDAGHAVGLRHLAPFPHEDPQIVPGVQVPIDLFQVPVGALGHGPLPLQLTGIVHPGDGGLGRFKNVL